MNDIRFPSVNRVILFGGARLLAELAAAIKARGRPEVLVVSSPRHLDEAVTDDGGSLRTELDRLGVEVFEEEEVNGSRRVAERIGPGTLGLAVGAAWVFEPDFVQRFAMPFLDFMGIDLPRYRGGAHYTWQILFNNRKGGCNLQVILGGEETFHQGPVIMRETYEFPAECRKPVDYFRQAVPAERDFVLRFLDQVVAGKSFTPQALDEAQSEYYPFLHTRSQGWIDWRWDAAEIERFIRAFDDPYPGASTRANGRRLILRDAQLQERDRDRHSFAAGLILRLDKRGLLIAARGGTLLVGAVHNEEGEDHLSRLEPGQRLLTPESDLQEAMAFEAVYTAKGLRYERKGAERKISLSASD